MLGFAGILGPSALDPPCSCACLCLPSRHSSRRRVRGKRKVALQTTHERKVALQIEGMQIEPIACLTHTIEPIACLLCDSLPPV
jgi:hypothetical protein